MTSGVQIISINRHSCTFLLSVPTAMCIDGICFHEVCMGTSVVFGQQKLELKHILNENSKLCQQLKTK